MKSYKATFTLGNRNKPPMRLDLEEYIRCMAVSLDVEISQIKALLGMSNGHTIKVIITAQQFTNFIITRRSRLLSSQIRWELEPCIDETFTDLRPK